MTCAELSQLIVQRVMSRAQEEPDPVDYLARACARLLMLGERAKLSGDIEHELIRFGFEWGILDPKLGTTVN